MESPSTYYVYDEKRNIKEIRTRILMDGKFKYVIQHLVSKNKYRPEFVSEERFYQSL